MVVEDTAGLRDGTENNMWRIIPTTWLYYLQAHVLSSCFTCIGSSAPFLSKYWYLYCGGQEGQKVRETQDAKTRKSFLVWGRKEPESETGKPVFIQFTLLYIRGFKNHMEDRAVTLMWAQCCDFIKKAFVADKTCTINTWCGAAHGWVLFTFT